MASRLGRPTTGQSWWCLLPTVNTEAMSAAQAECAYDEGIDAMHRAVHVLDGASWSSPMDCTWSPCRPPRPSCTWANGCGRL